MKSSNFGYIPALDHLRGFAALLVLYFHGAHFIAHKIQYNTPYDPANWPTASHPFSALMIEGHTAVSLFFVLSGFVFTVGALNKKINFIGFYRNRFLRTYPLFLFLLLLALFFSGNTVELVPLLKTIFFLANSTTAYNGGAFTFVFWSIAVEWHFYLLFPFLFLLVRKFNWPVLIGLIACLIGLRIAAYYEGMDMRLLSYWSIFGRLDQFLVGMGAGLIYAHKYEQGPFFNKVGLTGLLLVLGLLFQFNQLGGGALSTGIWILWPTIEGLGWGIFVLGYLSLAHYIPKIIANVLLSFGTISYSIYLLHYVVLDFFMARDWDTLIKLSDPLGTALINILLFVMPVVLIVATFTYFCIEKPFLGLRKGYMNRA